MQSEIPKSWRREKLAKLVKPRREKINPQSAGALPFIGMEHVEAHTMKVLGTVPAATMKSSAAAFCATDVLYGRLRPYLNKVCEPGFDGLCSAEFIVLPDRPHLRSSYLKYRLNASDFVRFTSTLNAGDRPRIDFEQIGDFEIEIPPEEEQPRIVSKIEELFSDLEAGAASLKRARKNLKRYRVSILKSAVEGRLTEKWRADHPNTEGAEKLIERIVTESSKTSGKGELKPSSTSTKNVQDPVSGLPRTWCRVAISQIAESLDSQRVPINKAERAKRKGDIPYYGANGQTGWIDDFLFDEPLVLVVEDETFTGREKDFSYVIKGKSWVNNHAHILRPYHPIAAEFLNFLLARYPFTPLTTGTTGRRKLTKKALLEARIPLPPIEEQNEIVRAIEENLTAIAHIDIQLSRSLARAARLRQSILKRAFEGKLC